MKFLLSRAGQAPRALGKLKKNRATVNSLMLSQGGIVVTAVIYGSIRSQDSL